jgi:hypothetical protein
MYRLLTDHACSGEHHDIAGRHAPDFEDLGADVYPQRLFGSPSPRASHRKRRFKPLAERFPAMSNAISDQSSAPKLHSSSRPSNRSENFDFVSEPKLGGWGASLSNP